MEADGGPGRKMVIVVLMPMEAVMVLLTGSTRAIGVLSMLIALVAALLTKSALVATRSAELVDAASGAPLAATSAASGAAEPAVGFCLTVLACSLDASLLPRS